MTPYPQIHNATGGNADAPTTDDTRQGERPAGGWSGWSDECYRCAGSGACPCCGTPRACHVCEGTGRVPDRGA